LVVSIALKASGLVRRLEREQRRVGGAAGTWAAGTVVVERPIEEGATLLVDLAQQIEPDLGVDRLQGGDVGLVGGVVLRGELAADDLELRRLLRELDLQPFPLQVERVEGEHVGIARLDHREIAVDGKFDVGRVLLEIGAHVLLEEGVPLVLGGEHLAAVRMSGRIDLALDPVVAAAQGVEHLIGIADRRLDGGHQRDAVLHPVHDRAGRVEALAGLDDLADPAVDGHPCDDHHAGRLDGAHGRAVAASAAWASASVVSDVSSWPASVSIAGHGDGTVRVWSSWVAGSQFLSTRSCTMVHAASKATKGRP
jgi:hypothetical protein